MKGTLAGLAIIVVWFASMYTCANWDPFTKSAPCARAVQLREYMEADRKRVTADRLTLKSKELEADASLVFVSPEYARQQPQEIEKRIGDITTPAAAQLAEDEGTVEREEKELSIVDAACEQKTPPR